MLRRRADPPSVAGNPLPGDADGRCEADVLIVAGDATPGLITISKAGIPYKWDKRTGYGYGGAWLVFTGDDLAEFDTVITIWRDDQKVAYDVWAKKYLTKPPAQPQQSGPTAAGRAAAAKIAQAAAAEVLLHPDAKDDIQSKAQSQVTALLNPVASFLPNIPKPKALGVLNPILAELQIKAIVPKFIGQWVRASAGRWTKTISWYQFKLPVPLLGRPNSSIDDVKKKAPVAQDAVQLEIKSKLDDVKTRQHAIAVLQGKT